MRLYFDSGDIEGRGGDFNSNKVIHGVEGFDFGLEFVGEFAGEDAVVAAFGFAAKHVFVFFGNVEDFGANKIVLILVSCSILNILAVNLGKFGKKLFVFRQHLSEHISVLRHGQKTNTG